MSQPRESDRNAPEQVLSLIYVVGRVDRGITTEMRSVLSAWDLSVPEYTTLSVLRNRPGLSNAQLARRAMIAPQSMIEVLAGLERRELLRREVDPDHQRILRAGLTASGEALMAAADPAIQAIQEQMLAGVSERDRRITLNALLKAVNVLSAGLGGNGLQQAE